MQIQYDPGFDTVREGQRVFRSLLAAMSWPGETQCLPPARLNPPAPWPPALLQVARTLLDAQVTFAIHGEGADILARYLNVNTGARSAPIQEADYVLAGGPFDRLDVWSLPAGTLLAPEKGATLILHARYLAGLPEDPDLLSSCSVSLTHKEGVTTMMLQGRGIRRQRMLLVDDAIGSVLERLAAREDEYPRGIDVVLVDDSIHLVALPRNTSWKKERLAWAM